MTCGSCLLNDATNLTNNLVVRCVQAHWIHIALNGHRTALLIAASRGHASVCRALIAHGADVRAVDKVSRAWCVRGACVARDQVPGGTTLYTTCVALLAGTYK